MKNDLTGTYSRVNDSCSPAMQKTLHCRMPHFHAKITSLFLLEMRQNTSTQNDNKTFVPEIKAYICITYRPSMKWRK